MSLDQAQLAYLSACSTAENSSQDLIDEVIHIASAFQLVGFPHVLGTFWEADDDAANCIARVFYTELARNLEASPDGRDQDAFAYALHHAVGALRVGQVENGMRPKKKPNDNVITWAPFIHLGC